MRARLSLPLALCTLVPLSLLAQARPKLLSVSNLSVYAADPIKAERFYVHDLGATKMPDPEHSDGARYYFNDTQFVEVLPLPQGEADPKNRLHSTGYNTADVEAMRKYLAAQGFATPATSTQDADGGRHFEVTDPEGNHVEFVQPPSRPAHVAAGPVSRHIIHVGIIVHNLEKEEAFYNNVLGFRPYWHGGKTEDSHEWTSAQVPDGMDWIEYMSVQGPETTGIPKAMSQDTAGVLNHFALGVDNIEQAYNRLYERDGLSGKHSAPQLGRDGKWQLNLYDRDGVRAELMEFQPAEKPCCSPFLLPSPTK